MKMREGEQIDKLEAFSYTARKLGHLRLNPLQIEILGELVDGNRTMTELTLSIFDLDYRNEEYETCHSRTRRAVKKLEGSGFVSKKRLFEKKALWINDIRSGNHHIDRSRHGSSENNLQEGLPSAHNYSPHGSCFTVDR
jgi:hypothetical protein